MSRPRLASIVAIVLLPACADDPASGTESLPSSTSTTGDASTSTAAETPTTTSTATSTTGDDETPALEYARGIRLTRATINQGVQLEIVRDGAEVPSDELGARLLSGRKAVMRADWLLHADFTPREIVGRLTLWTPEGETRVDDFEVMVNGPSNDGDLFTTFSWELPASLVGPGLQYRIEALEPDPALASGEISDPPPILPLAGRGTLHVEDAPMELKVELVPLKHVIDGMTCTPTITDADIEAMRVWIEQHNPVQRAVLTVHAPWEYTATIGDEPNGFVPILTKLGELRAADAPADNVYYYGLIESCDGYPPGLLGQAAGIPDQPTPGYAYQRLAVGRYQSSGAGARDTFVHEVGHTQGLYHVRCSGGEAGADPEYPYANGRIGRWGYGIHDTGMRSPTSFRDYMSYCSQSWVSDFGWEKTFDSIRELTSWDAGGAPPDPQARPIAVGTLMKDGKTHWYTTVGAVPLRGRASDTFVEFALDGATVREPAAALEIPDSDATMVVAALPAGTLAGLSFKTGGKLRAAASASQVVRLD
ncbi:M66 family metalloprotease [Nannocystis pusilla]|uniref:M66 family metalloprotease n=1 Tax=Nannocystis pusilla TaxID=889268 RepID=UPI003BF1F8A6